MSDTNQIVAVDKKPITVDELQVMAKAMGPLFKKRPEDMFALMLIAQAEGLHPAIAAQEYDIIDGRPAINSRSALARFQKSGGSVEYVERTDSVCTINFSHPGGGIITVSWTLKMAEQAGLLNKDNWKKYKRAMLNARCIAEGVRALFPACLSGLYTVEEVRDFPEIRDVTNSVTEPANTEGKIKRKEVLDFIKSVSDQIPEDNKREIRAWIDSSKYDIDELTALKSRVEQVVSQEPELPVMGNPISPPSDDPEIDDIAGESFDDGKELGLF